jgi:hypothetical protein
MRVVCVGPCRWGMGEIKKAVTEGVRQLAVGVCSFSDELASVAEGWDGDINGTHAYVLRDYLIVLLKNLIPSAKGGEKAVCVGRVY